MTLTLDIKKNTQNKHFAWYYPQDLLLLMKDVKKTCIFTQKWLEHWLLMTSYLVTIATGHHWTCLKMCAGMNKQLLKTSGADVLTSRKKKNLKKSSLSWKWLILRNQLLHLLHGRKKLRPPRRFIHLINDNIYHYNALRVLTGGKCQQSSVTYKC